MNKKRVVIVIAGFAAALLTMFIIFGFCLSDGNISGFNGMTGAVRLAFSKESGVKLTQEPLQFLIRRDNKEEKELHDFLEGYTDSYKSDPDTWNGTAVIDGENYAYSCRAFTKVYMIIMFTKI